MTFSFNSVWGWVSPSILMSAKAGASDAGDKEMGRWGEEVRSPCLVVPLSALSFLTTRQYFAVC